MESGDGVACSGPLNRKDDKTGIEAWVFSMSSQPIAAMFERAGTRLFARNVRGFLGSTEINTSMQQTLEKEPGYFWYTITASLSSAITPASSPSKAATSCA